MWRALQWDELFPRNLGKIAELVLTLTEIG